ncbi:hypothetical protein GCM10027258_62190 [Amycolatopsis stemonae]
MTADTTIRTRITIAGADFYPRRDVRDDEIHWCYGPRLRPEIPSALYLCQEFGGGGVNLRDLTVELDGGTPCPNCNRRAPLPTTGTGGAP